MQVPEISKGMAPRLNADNLLALVKRSQQVLGKERAVPMLVGPITMARLAKLEGTSVGEVVKGLVPAYQELLRLLGGLQVCPRRPLVFLPCFVFRHLWCCQWQLQGRLHQLLYHKQALHYFC